MRRSQSLRGLSFAVAVAVAAVAVGAGALASLGSSAAGCGRACREQEGIEAAADREEAARVAGPALRLRCHRRWEYRRGLERLRRVGECCRNEA